jgi:hypothetical protein
MSTHHNDKERGEISLILIGDRDLARIVSNDGKSFDPPEAKARYLTSV